MKTIDREAYLAYALDFKKAIERLPLSAQEDAKQQIFHDNACAFFGF